MGLLTPKSGIGAFGEEKVRLVRRWSRRLTDYDDENQQQRSSDDDQPPMQRFNQTGAKTDSILYRSRVRKQVSVTLLPHTKVAVLLVYSSNATIAHDNVKYKMH